MALNTFSTIKSAVSDWLDRDDIATVVDQFITLTETRLYSVLRVRQMETALSLTISSGTVTLPADFLEFKHAYVDGAPTQSLEFKGVDWIYKNYPTRSSGSKPVYAAVDAGTVLFGPYPDSNYVIKGTYYAKPAALVVTTNETNFLTTSYPDILLYGALVQSSYYLGQDERLIGWQAGYDEALNRLMDADKKERFPTTTALRTAAA